MNESSPLVEKSGQINAPRVSVVVPAYNHEKYIADAVKSVLQQTFTDFELIIIDDGSSDNTLKEIKKFEDPRIRIFSQENRGAARTINWGFELARGEFVSILNSDDAYHIDRLYRFVSVMEEKPDCMIAASLIRAVDETGKNVEPGSQEHYWRKWYEKAVHFFEVDPDPFGSLLRHNFIVTTSNIFIRSEILRRNKLFDPLLVYCHDYEFLLRIISTYPFEMLWSELLDYRIHSQNTIRENEFLKHLEVLYAVFNNVDLEKFLAKPDLKERVSDPLFQMLLNNPEVNLEKYHSQYMALIKKKDDKLVEISALNRNLYAEIQKRENRLAQASEWLKDRKREALNYEKKLSEAHYWLGELKVELENNKQKIQRKEKDLVSLTDELRLKESTLQEIYESKGWLWLTRYRKLKYEFRRIPDRLKNFMMAGQRRLSVYRKIKDKLKSPFKPCVTNLALIKESRETIAQHVEVLKPLEPDRPMVVHAIANFMTGGSSRLVADLVEHLGHRYEQEVITFFAPEPPAYTGFPIHQAPRSEDAILTFLRKKKTKMLHVHYWGECDDPWYKKVFQAAAQTRCIVIENVNTPVETYIDNIIDHYVYVSGFARNFSSTVPEASTVIYPGSNLKMFQRNGEPIPDDVIGMVYRLENDKLREDSIQVFIEVVRRRPSTKAIIVGGGSFLGPYKKQVADVGLSENFQFTDYVPYDQLPQYYRRFSLFVAPVWKESFGQVSPFAMGMEIPVAGYDIGALPEILDGRECLGKNPEHLADIIIDLLDNRVKRLEIGARNRKRAFENFSVEAMVKNYDLLYQQLLSKSPKIL